MTGKVSELSSLAGGYRAWEGEGEGMGYHRGRGREEGYHMGRVGGGGGGGRRGIIGRRGRKEGCYGVGEGVA